MVRVKPYQVVTLFKKCSKNAAEQFTLNNASMSVDEAVPHVRCLAIEYPGYVRDVSEVIDSLSGYSGITQAHTSRDDGAMQVLCRTRYFPLPSQPLSHTHIIHTQASIIMVKCRQFTIFQYFIEHLCSPLQETLWRTPSLARDSDPGASCCVLRGLPLPWAHLFRPAP